VRHPPVPALPVEFAEPVVAPDRGVARGNEQVLQSLVPLTGRRDRRYGGRSPTACCGVPARSKRRACRGWRTRLRRCRLQARRRSPRFSSPAASRSRPRPPRAALLSASVPMLRTWPTTTRALPGALEKSSLRSRSLFANEAFRAISPSAATRRAQWDLLPTSIPSTGLVRDGVSMMVSS
jgi:hypothetical protein